MEKILVTAPRSKVGLPLVNQLVSAGLRPILAVRNPETLTVEDLEVRQLDLTRRQTFAPVVAGVDAAFVVWPAGVGPVSKSVIPLLEALVEAGTRRLVFLSVFGAGTLKFLPHARVERWLADQKIAYTSIRAGYFMQNLSTIHREDVVTHDEVFVPAGRGHLAMVDCRDVAAVAHKALTEPGHERTIYELTGPDSVGFSEVAAIFSEELGRPISYPAPGLWRFAKRWKKRDVDPVLLTFMVVEYACTRLDRSGRITDDVARVLGRPPTTLRQFIADMRGCWSPAATS